MWPGFKSQSLHYNWVEFAACSCLCIKGFSLGSLVFLPPQKKEPKLQSLRVIQSSCMDDCSQTEVLKLYWPLCASTSSEMACPISFCLWIIPERASNPWSCSFVRKKKKTINKWDTVAVHSCFYGHFLLFIYAHYHEKRTHATAAVLPLNGKVKVKSAYKPNRLSGWSVFFPLIPLEGMLVHCRVTHLVLFRSSKILSRGTLKHSHQAYPVLIMLPKLKLTHLLVANIIEKLC